MGGSEESPPGVPAGAIVPATRCVCSMPAGGPKPPASARPATSGRFAPRRVGRRPALYMDLPVYVLLLRAGGGNAVRFVTPPGVAVLCIPGCTVSLAGAIAPAAAPR